MMSREEMILALRAYAAIERLDRLIVGITGEAGLSGSSFEDVFCITELIYKNYSLNNPDSDEAYADFMAVLSAGNMSAEAKCDTLMDDIDDMDEEKKKGILEKFINLLHDEFPFGEIMRFIAAVSTDPEMARQVERKKSMAELDALARGEYIKVKKKADSISDSQMAELRERLEMVLETDEAFQTEVIDSVKEEPELYYEVMDYTEKHPNAEALDVLRFLAWYKEPSDEVDHCEEPKESIHDKRRDAFDQMVIELFEGGFYTIEEAANALNVSVEEFAKEMGKATVNA